MMLIWVFGNQVYVTAPEAFMAIVSVEQIVFDVVVTLTVAGTLTVTIVEADEVQLWLSVTVTEYVPPLPLAARVGFCDVDVKLFTPDQLYDVIEAGPPVNAIV